MLVHAVAGVDFTPGWERMRSRLGVLATLGVGHLTLVHVLGGNYPAAPEMEHREHYERRLAEEADALAGVAPTIDWQVRVGDPGREVASAASEVGADLVVVGSAGHTPLHDAVFGNQVSAVIGYGQLPTLLVPLGEQVAAGGGGVVLGTDGSEAARPAEALARELAGRLPLVVVTVTDEPGEPPDIGRHAGMFAVDGGQVEVIVRHGRPSEQISQVAEECRADLIVVGRRGRNPVVDLFVGSTAERIVDGANRPVMLGI